MIINKKEIKTFDIQHLKQFVSSYEQHQVDSPAGQESYKLLAYIANMFNDIKICELGTRYGTSAIMLADNPRNQVDTYDIRIYEKDPGMENLKFYIKDMFTDENIAGLLDYKIIFVCVTDPRNTIICKDGDHTGLLEKKLYNFLDKNNWDGILIIGAIGPSWPETHKLWNKLPTKYPKYDVTDIGHASGTGIVDFSRKLEIV